MSDIIRLLPDSVANQIAAGEVIQRPASVIKELVENAVDAGAKHIHVSVTDAGRTAIQVIDDGKGMSETDARLAFDRHATSKIHDAADLFNLHTMGFRGEALASIVAVAQVELKTRQHDEEIGTDLTMAASKVVSQEPCACPEGSNFLVENLFFNVPARRKFLKSNATELNNIIAAFERIVLVYPAISFTFHSNGTELYNLPAAGLRQRIVDVFGKRINQDLLPVEVDTSVCGIRGFVGKPESAKRKGARQFFFVNGRYMRHPYFHKAVMAPFERLVPQGEQVPYFLYFDVDPKDIDVNIHPTKTEIKFENEQAIWQILTAAVKDAVGAFNDVSTIDFDTEGTPEIPVYQGGDPTKQPQPDFDPNYNPFKETPPEYLPQSAGAGRSTGKDGSDPYGYSSQPHVPSQWDRLYTGLQGHKPAGGELLPQQPDADNEADLIAEKAPAHYQYKGRYIMTAVKSGLMIIDQHRAHVRILFEQYRSRLDTKKVHSQKELFPHTVEFEGQEAVTYGQIAKQIAAMGFELTSLGGNTYAINAVPEGFEAIDIPGLLHDMIHEAQDRGSATLSQIYDALALGMARSAAIPYGQVLSNEEMEAVINQLFLCKNVNYTPDGKSVFCILRQGDIEQMLG